MLETLISSKTRIKLLLKFFLNSSSKGYLRSLEQEFGESSNAIRLELNKFEKAGMLKSAQEGKKKVYHANKEHPLFGNLHTLMMKYVGLDLIIDKITERLGDVQLVYLVGDYAQGRDSGVIDLLLIASDLNLEYLAQLINKVEREIDRKIRYIQYRDIDEIKTPLKQQDHLLLWKKN